MTIEELTRNYVKSFKKGPLSSETRIAYDRLQQVGESLGVDLNKAFFKEIMKRYQDKPEKYKNISPEQLNTDILSQYQAFIMKYQEHLGDGHIKNGTVKPKERRTSIEIL